MRLSLLAQMAIVIALVMLGALTAVLTMSEHTIKQEFQRIIGAADTTALAGAKPVLEKYYAEHTAFRWPGVDSVIERLPRGQGASLVLVNPAGEVVGSTLPRLRRAWLVGPAGPAIQIERTIPGAPPGAGLHLIIDHAPSVDLRSPHDRSAGRLYSIVVPDEEQMLERTRLRLATRRGVAVPVLLFGTLAAALMLVLAGRVLRPIGALTAAARRLERGDLSARTGVTSRDELGDLSHAFDAMAESLERSETLRRQLVTDVAHELRTPLTNLRCQLEAVQDGLLAPDAATWRSLHDETLLLGRLVEDLQVLSLAESGNLPLHRQPVAVAELVDSALAAVHARAASAGVVLRRGPVADAIVDVDPERIGQVLRNLLANAITHTRPGRAVEVSASRDAAWVRLAVRDEGEGIAPDQLPFVFERFWRADASRARATGGAGLGLAIVRRLVEAHGGSVAVTSEQGRGTTFTCTLPAARG